MTIIITMAASAYGLSARDVVKLANIFEKSIGVGPMKNIFAENVPKKELLNCIFPLSAPNS